MVAKKIDDPDRDAARRAVWSYVEDYFHEYCDIPPDRVRALLKALFWFGENLLTAGRVMTRLFMLFIGAAVLFAISAVGVTRILSATGL